LRKTGAYKPWCQLRLEETKEGSFTCVKFFGFEPGLQLDMQISNISDSFVGELSSTPAYFRGTKHKARVIGYSPVENLVQLSLQDSVINKKFLNVGELEVGQICRVSDI
jgi:hypothetical protein